MRSDGAIFSWKKEKKERRGDRVKSFPSLFRANSFSLLLEKGAKSSKVKLQMA